MAANKKPTAGAAKPGSSKTTSGTPKPKFGSPAWNSMYGVGKHAKPKGK